MGAYSRIDLFAIALSSCRNCRSSGPTAKREPLLARTATSRYEMIWQICSDLDRRGALQQHQRRILNELPELLKELCSHSAINDAMVAAKRDIEPVS